MTSEAKKGDSENTIKFLEYLKSKRPEAKLLIIWDGASYHCSQQIQDYLDSLNRELEAYSILITRLARKILI
ncbi:hypothetical protein CDG77_15600 [Nostoc sp. 'Peltigera membranacea cyanobiont' 213]|nr:hypothetical protein CDG77_15600 [Nostoc sp. 'Peltigera membranacea cyanobiont' 213]